MKRLLGILSCAAILNLLPGAAHAQSPTASKKFSLQGVVAGIADGVYDMRVEFLGGTTTATLPVSAVPVAGGVFNIVADTTLIPAVFISTLATPTFEITLKIDTAHVNDGATYDKTFTNIPISAVPVAFVAHKALHSDFAAIAGSVTSPVSSAFNAANANFATYANSALSASTAAVLTGSFAGDMSGNQSATRVDRIGGVALQGITADGSGAMLGSVSAEGKVLGVDPSTKKFALLTAPTPGLATGANYGVVKIGSGIAVNAGEISVPVGAGIGVYDDTNPGIVPMRGVSATGKFLRGDGWADLPLAGVSSLGAVKIGAGLSVDGDGLISVPPMGYALGTVLFNTNPAWTPPSGFVLAYGQKLSQGTYGSYVTAMGPIAKFVETAPVTMTSPPTSYNSVVSVDGSIWVDAGSDSFYRSTDGGVTWGSVIPISGFSGPSIAVKVAGSGVELLLRSDTQYVRYDGTAAKISYTTAGANYPSGKVGVVSPASNKVLIAGNSYGGSSYPSIDVSSDSGSTLTTVSGGVIASLNFVKGIANNGQNVVVIGTDASIRSTDAGANWSAIPSLSGIGMVAITYVSGTNFCAVDQAGYGWGSSDDGQTWVQKSMIIPNFYGKIYVASGIIIAINSSSGSWISTDCNRWIAGPDFAYNVVLDSGKMKSFSSSSTKYRNFEVSASEFALPRFPNDGLFRFVKVQ